MTYLRFSTPRLHLGMTGLSTLLVLSLCTFGWATEHPRALQGKVVDAPPAPGFVENCGQLPGEIAYSTRLGDLRAYFRHDSVELVLGDPEHRSSRLTVELLRANDSLRVVSRDERPGKVNVYLGNDPAQWFSGLPTYGELLYRGVYPGVDLVFRREGSGLKSEWIVAPDASPASIRWRYEGASAVMLEGETLRVECAAGSLFEVHPFFYQVRDGQRREIEGGYVVSENDEVGFRVGPYDPELPLVLDPDLEWSTFLGGSAADRATDIAVDGAGNVVVAGIRYSTDFPATGGALDSTLSGRTDVFVSKLDPSGSTLLFSTYLGGSSDEPFDASVAVDPSGDVFVAGGTYSSDFPTTAGAFDTTDPPFDDAFVTRLNAGGGLVYSTFLGGNGGESCRAIAVDAAGCAYVAGQTDSADFPVSPGAWDATLGGQVDFFVTKLDAMGSSLVYSTYLGGSGIEGLFTGVDLAVDVAGAAYVTGKTDSADYPTTVGAFDTIGGALSDGFVTKLDPTGSSLVYSTFLAGSSSDECFGIAVDAAGDAFVVGRSASTDFPVTPGAYDTIGGANEGFLTKLTPAGDGLIYSTFLGLTLFHSAIEIAIDGAGNAALVGQSIRNVEVRQYDATGSRLLFLAEVGSGQEPGTNYGGAIVAGATGDLYFSGVCRNLYPATSGAFDTTFNGGDDAFVTKLRPGPVLDLVGTPAPGQPVSFLGDQRADGRGGCARAGVPELRRNRWHPAARRPRAAAHLRWMHDSERTARAAARSHR